MLTEQDIQAPLPGDGDEPAPAAIPDHRREQAVENAPQEVSSEFMEVKGEILRLRTDVERNAARLRKAVAMTGLLVVLGLAGSMAWLSFAWQSHAAAPPPPQATGPSEPSAGSGQALAALNAQMAQMRGALDDLKAQLETLAKEKAQAAERSRPGESLRTAADCASLPADVDARAVDVSIQFEVGSARIPSAAEVALDSIAKMLVLFPDRCVLVEGYADVSGKADKNMALSKARAASVVDFIVERGGVERKRLVPVGRGTSASLPGVEAHDPKNRRVLFKVVN